ncbi:MAG TPA: peptide-methionine (R)-S-oxide reductase MsrB [Caulobacteraceae bacterium]|jgi:peptide-methionine (R)-S-oxide reductase|nr:peptide-methionine (R)-S-oxide reductase MsrB [Caulobacteraceae bacterium]
MSQLSRRTLLLSSLAVVPLPALAADPFATSPWRKLADADWKRRLPPASYEILRRDGTERPFTSPLLGEHRAGTFVCLACGLPLFKSQWKFDSHTGWPSFYDAINGALARKSDFLLIAERTEYHCARCLGHQGHVFNDGPRPTGLRYCNDGVALRFAPA